MLRLSCPVQNYAWGRPAAESQVAQLYGASGGEVCEDQRYAELWMGEHPSGPAVVQRSGARLKGWLEEHPKALGSMVLERWGAQLPFLFKVLSVDTALSIQSHPDKALAEKLHAERPQVYKDANHKPEMAVALEDFEALCGFAPLEEICAEIAVHPEVQKCLGAGATQALLSAVRGCSSHSHTERLLGGPPGGPLASAPEAKLRLKQAFTALMTCDSSIVSSAVTQLAARLSSSSQPLSDKQLLVLRLNKQYPQDVGVLSVFFFNYMRLPKGSGLSLPANEPHAYLSGEIVECMATSDNVIRAGLTPKLRDTSVLCESLSYECRRPTVLEGRQTTAVTRTYRPPFEEFELHNLQITPSAVSLLRAGTGPALMLQLGGDAQAQVLESKLDNCTDLERDAALKRGDVVLVPAGTTVALQAGDSGACLWVATCNSSSFAAECAPATTAASSAATTTAGTPAAAVGASLVGAA